MLSTQRAINSHLVALKPPSDLVPDLIRTVCETLDWSFGAFWTPTAADGDALEVAAVWHHLAPPAPADEITPLLERAKRAA